MSNELYELVRSILLYDQDTGIFTSTVKRYVINVGQEVGCINLSGYVQIQIDWRIYYGHRLAWLYMTGSFPVQQIDHINGKRSDNRWANLREATPLINAQNRQGARKDNKTSGLLGVSKHADGRWTARIKIGNKYQHLGQFSTAEQASEAYLEAKREHHQGCTI